MRGLAALQDCLAAEHAALYGYGVVGGRLSALRAVATTAQPKRELDSAVTAAQAAYVEHRRRRDRLTTLVEAAGAAPVAAFAVYRTPAVSSLADCRKLARRLEGRCADVFGIAVSRTVGSSRSFAASALVDCSRRQVAWGAPVEAFPGIREY